MFLAVLAGNSELNGRSGYGKLFRVGDSGFPKSEYRINQRGESIMLCVRRQKWCKAGLIINTRLHGDDRVTSVNSVGF